MLGSVHEAEDLVQQTFLYAWRGFDRYEECGSFRAWLYQIATNACLNALAIRRNARRYLPEALGPATTDMPDGKATPDILYVEPFPDSYLDEIADEAPTPEAAYASSEAVRLAFVAAIQDLPPSQRAVLLLRDVLGWSAIETANLLGGSVVSINSALQRARKTLATRYPKGRPASGAPQGAREEALLRRYLNAWEQLDVDELTALLKEEATYTMPPLPQWYAGREAIRAFFSWAWQLYKGFKLVRTAANGQPAFAAYARAEAGAPWQAHSLHLLTLADGLIAGLTVFYKPDGPQLFAAFRLPASLPPDRPFDRES